MYSYNTDTHDQQLDAILRFLFEYQPQSEKLFAYQPVKTLFEQLELSAMYQLFALIHEQLPRKARLLFAAEDYRGKQALVLEVMQHIRERV
ncbi:hypothetical protein HXZ64_12100 [Acinetobacter indicus]|uniref:hypothetical protein n=1 Tax=Acinetobacter indicus TaxID=756892 RepID=UPI0025770643|nr:hypothetical protein [Acinetobacter indicus]MDM1281692.1 hypothetical protein [Acinetobacter indicus]